MYIFLSLQDSNPIFLFSKNTSDPPPAIHDLPAQSGLDSLTQINDC